MSLLLNCPFYVQRSIETSKCINVSFTNIATCLFICIIPFEMFLFCYISFNTFEVSIRYLTNDARDHMFACQNNVYSRKIGNTSKYTIGGGMVSSLYHPLGPVTSASYLVAHMCISG